MLPVLQHYCSVIYNYNVNLLERILGFLCCREFPQPIHLSKPFSSPLLSFEEELLLHPNFICSDQFKHCCVSLISQNSWTQQDFLFASFFSLDLWTLPCASPHIPYKVSSPKISSEEELALQNRFVNSSKKLADLLAPPDMLKTSRQ